MNPESHLFRLRAVQCEQRARDAADALIKREWEDIALEWHLLANAIGKASGETPQIDIA